MSGTRETISLHLLRMVDKHVVQPELNSAMKHLLGRGKLYRPRLALAAYESITASAPDDRLLLAVTPLELVHTFTLIHDDLPCMDNATMRRGLSAVHVEYGDALAVLAGDGLSTLAFQVLTDAELGLSHQLAFDLAATLARSTQEILEGQVLDLAAEHQQLGESEIFHLQRRKTGALLSACCEFGAILAGASDSLRGTFRAVGVELGTLFQMRDDLLSAESSERQTGKSHTDRELGKSTLVYALGIEAVKIRAAEMERELLRLVESAALAKPQVFIELLREAYHRDH